MQELEKLVNDYKNLFELAKSSADEETYAERQKKLEELGKKIKTIQSSKKSDTLTY